MTARRQATGSPSNPTSGASGAGRARGGRAGHVGAYPSGRSWARLGTRAKTHLGGTDVARDQGEPCTEPGRAGSAQHGVPGARERWAEHDDPASRSTCSHTSGCAAAARSTSAPAPWVTTWTGRPLARSGERSGQAQRHLVDRAAPVVDERFDLVGQAQSVEQRLVRTDQLASAGPARTTLLAGRTPRWSTPPSVTPDTFGRAVRPRRRPRDPSP